MPPPEEEVPAPAHGWCAAATSTLLEQLPPAPGQPPRCPAVPAQPLRPVSLKRLLQLSPPDPWRGVVDAGPRHSRAATAAHSDGAAMAATSRTAEPCADAPAAPRTGAAAMLSPSHRRRAPSRSRVLRRRPVPGWCALPQRRPRPAGTRPPPQGWRLMPALTRRSGIELSMLDTAGKRVSRPVRNASNPASPSVTTRSR